MSPRRNLSAGVALCLLATLSLTARAAEPDPPKPSLDTLQKSIDALRTEVQLSTQVTKEAQKEFAALKQRIEALEKEVVTMGQALGAAQKEQQRISNYLSPGSGGPATTEEPVGLTLEARIRRLESRLKAVEDRVDVVRPAPSLIQQTGTIRLENRFHLPATFLINGVGYRLQPGEARNLTGYQAGAFTFEVMVDGYGLTGTGTRSLRPNGVYTLFATNAALLP